MTIFTQGPRARDPIFEEAPVTVWESVAASAREAWIRSPTSSLSRMSDLAEMQYGRPINWGTGEFAEPLEYSGPETPVVPADDARRSVREKGLDIQVPDTGISQAALDELVDRKQKEQMRQYMLDNAPGGFFPGVARFGVSIGVSMLDPINVASAFVPVVGPERYAAMLKNAGGAAARAGIRARVGAAEGVVGQALVEPIVYGAAQAEQADYGMADSLLNIAFGSLMGAGLHTGLGAVSDAITKGKPWQTAEPAGSTAERTARWSPQEREAVGRTAIAQAVSGKPIDVEPLVRLRDSLAEIRPASIEEARFQAVESLRETMREELLPEAGQKLSRGEVKQLQQERADVAYKLEHLDETYKATAKQLQKNQNLSRKQAETQARKAIDADRAQLTERAAVIDKKLESHSKGAAAHADLSRLEQGIVPERFKETVEAKAKTNMDAGRLREKQVAAGVRQALNPTQRRVATAVDDLRAAATAEPQKLSPLADETGHQEAMRRLQEYGSEEADKIEAEVGEEVRRLQELADQLEQEVNLEAADAEIAAARTTSKALRAAALCGIRR